MSYSEARASVHAREAVLVKADNLHRKNNYPTLQGMTEYPEGAEYTFKGSFWDIFRDVFEIACQRVHLNNRRKGFWPDDNTEKGKLRLALYPDTHGRNPAEMLALMTSEHSEALDAVRSGGLDHKDDKLTHRSGFLTEIADAVIRAMDGFGGLMADAGSIIVEKVAYNDKSRGYLHGKKF